LSQHKNIVRLLAISWDEDDIIESSTLEDVIRPVLVVELAWEEHPDLASFMKFCSQSPGSAVVEDVLSLVSDVADGLAALHSFGVVHGDLKPQNILLFLDPDKAVAGPERKHKFPALVAKIGDFGFSGTISTEEDVHGGTQFWNAPECLPSCPDAEMRSYATKQTRDIYSYALILVHLVTNGGSPFEGFATDLNAIDAAKLEGRVADHCCDLIRRARSFDLSDKLIDTIVDFLAGALLHNPCDRLCNIGGVRELLTGMLGERYLIQALPC
jgi:serine/threonine protein kinase